MLEREIGTMSRVVSNQQFARSAALCAVAASALWLFSGCAPHWALTKGKEISSNSGKYRVREPEGWMVFRDGPITLFSKHGLDIESIWLKGTDIAKPAAGNAAPGPKPGMALHEIASIVLLSFYASPSVYNIELVEESPVEIQRNPAIKVELRYRASGGVVKRAVVHAFTCGTRFFELGYCALQTYYFDRHLNDYMKVVKEFVNR